MSQNFRMFSPLALLGLAACGGGTTTGGGGTPTAQSSGVAVKGLLQNALAFVDSDGSRTLNGNETFTRTDENGAYTLDNPNGDPVVIVTDRLTTDKSSGAVLPGVRLMGAADAKVISPFSGLALQGVDTSALAKALNVEGVDLLTFNPYASGVDATQALAVEKLSQQMVGTLKILAGAMVGSGTATEAEAFNSAFDALIKVTRDQLTQDTPQVDFKSDALLSALIEQVNTAGKINDADVTALVNKIKQINGLTDGVNALDGSEASNVFSSYEVLADAYEDSLTKGNGTDVQQVADNAIPVDITLTTADGAPLSVTETIMESKPVDDKVDQLVGKVSVTDDGASVGTIEILGKHAALFEMRGDQLVLREFAMLDYERSELKKLDITLMAKDAGGKSIARSFEIAIANVDESAIVKDFEITGSFRALEPLSVNLSKIIDPDNEGGDFSEIRYEWSADGKVLAGETGATFTPTADMVDDVISVRVTLVDKSGGQTVIDTTATTPVAAPKPEVVKDAPVEAHIYGDIAPQIEKSEKQAEKVADDTQEWSGNVLKFMGEFQKTLDFVAKDLSGEAPQPAAAFARAAFAVADPDPTPKVTYSFGADGSYMQWKAEVDWDGDGKRDNWIEVEFESVNASTLSELDALFKSVSLSDPSSLSVAGTVHQIGFHSTTEAVQLTHRASDSPDYDSTLSVSYQVKDAGGNAINDPSKLETLNLLGSFDNGIEPLLKLAADGQKMANIKEPATSDYINAATREFDQAGYDAAKEAYETALNQAEFDVLGKLLGGDGQTAIAGIEGMELVHYKDGNGDHKTAFKVDLFDKPDADGNQTAVVQVGDYSLEITGKMPQTPASLLPLLNPETGAGFTADYIKSLYADGAEPGADKVFDALMNGFSKDGKTYAGLKDGGVEEIKSIVLSTSDTSVGSNGKLAEIDIDFDAVTKLLADDAVKADAEPVVFTDTKTGHSVAQHPDGYYVVLGEGIGLDDFKELLDLDDTGAAVA